MKGKEIWLVVMVFMLSSISMNGCKSKTESEEGKTKSTNIHEAAEHGNQSAVKKFLTQGVQVDTTDEYGFTPLYRACINGHKDIAEFLVTKGADVNAKGNSGWTPLFIAAMAGHINVTEFLLEEGAEINAKDNEGNTPLHYTAGNAETDIVKILISNGANINARNKKGETVLDRVKVRLKTWHQHPFLAKRMKALKACAELLHERGAQ